MGVVVASGSGMGSASDAGLGFAPACACGVLHKFESVRGISRFDSDCSPPQTIDLAERRERLVRPIGVVVVLSSRGESRQRGNSKCPLVRPEAQREVAAENCDSSLLVGSG
jgi:hypothetical protein